MIVALEFNDTFDLTAVATGLLAVATFVALFFTRRSLKQAQKAIDLSRKEVEEAHRPVLVPVLDKTSMDLGADGQLERRPQLLRDSKLVVPVENIGAGPALNPKLFVAGLDAAGMKIR